MNSAISIDQMLVKEFFSVHGVEPKAGSIEDVRNAHFDRNTFALCLSGGGIRSAAFCLGAVQTLSRNRLFEKLHYISSVSGGGYTASMLAAWIYRAKDGTPEVQRELCKTRSSSDGASPENWGIPREPLDWLRGYTNYLTPRFGIASLDTWALAATYIRNLLVHWLLLIPILLLAVALPKLLVELFENSHSCFPPTWAYFAGSMFIFIGCVYLRWRTFSPSSQDNANSSTPLNIFIWTSLTGAFLLCYGAKHLPAVEMPNYSASVFAWAYIGLMSFALGIDIAFSKKKSENVSTFNPLIANPNWSALAVMTYLYVAAGFQFLLLQDWPIVFAKLSNWSATSVAFEVSIAPIVILLGIVAIETLLVAFLRPINDDLDREWWTRAIAKLFLTASLGGVFVLVIVAGPSLTKVMLAKYENHLWLSDVSSYLWLLGLMLAALLARAGFSRQTRPSVASQEKKFQPKIPDVVFDGIGILLIVFLLFELSHLHDWLNKFVFEHRSLKTSLIDSRAKAEGIVFVVIGMIALLASIVVPVNRFSLHGMYRERLVRAFLAATRLKKRDAAVLKSVPSAAEPEFRQFDERAGDAFTGFDRHDNPVLYWLDPSRRAEPRRQSPMHLINCALNMVGDRDTRYRERKADSFTFSPLFVGSERTGYRESNNFVSSEGGITLGTAMTISGAAISPNSGYHSRPVLTFLLTVFNARLGWWVGNPGHPKTSKLADPRFSHTLIVRELLGQTNSDQNWVHLSDGGHFDNLGLYEMVRRGCRRIIAIDASADPLREFSDLTNSIRKIRIDLGISMHVESIFAIGGRDKGEEGRYCALFRIDYGNGKLGKLLYVKSAYYRFERRVVPLDVEDYAQRSSDFPHESTTDQFFNESQFESYRALGEHEMRAILGDDPDVDIFFAASTHISSGLQPAT